MEVKTSSKLEYVQRWRSRSPELNRQRQKGYDPKLIKNNNRRSCCILYAQLVDDFYTIDEIGITTMVSLLVTEER